MGMFDKVISRNTPDIEIEAYVPPDLSGMTDRELLEATYLKIAQAEHLLTQTFKGMAANPLFGSMLPKGL